MVYVTQERLKDRIVSVIVPKYDKGKAVRVRNPDAGDLFFVAVLNGQGA